MYVLLLKVSETETEAIYRFGPDEQHLGLLRLRKAESEIEEIEPYPGEATNMLFTRAAFKLLQHWKQGSLPERTSWAS